VERERPLEHAAREQEVGLVRRDRAEDLAVADVLGEAARLGERVVGLSEVDEPTEHVADRAEHVGPAGAVADGLERLLRLLERRQGFRVVPERDVQRAEVGERAPAPRRVPRRLGHAIGLAERRPGRDRVAAGQLEGPELEAGLDGRRVVLRGLRDRQGLA
jgi:hypothetical protein